MSHQEDSYNQLQQDRSCKYRKELHLQTKTIPAGGCCKEKQIVVGSHFFCDFLNRKVTDFNICWACRDRK